MRSRLEIICFRPCSICFTHNIPHDSCLVSFHIISFSNMVTPTKNQTDRTTVCYLPQFPSELTFLYFSKGLAIFQMLPAPMESQAPRWPRNEAPHLVLVDFGLAEIVEAIDHRFCQIVREIIK